MYKLTQLLNDTNFMKKVLEARTKDEVKELFKNEGFKLEDEDLKVLAKFINKSIEKSAKLSEEDLNNIAGGILKMIGYHRSSIVLGNSLCTSRITSKKIRDAVENVIEKTASWWKKV